MVGAAVAPCPGHNLMLAGLHPRGSFLVSGIPAPAVATKSSIGGSRATATARGEGCGLPCNSCVRIFLLAQLEKLASASV